MTNNDIIDNVRGMIQETDPNNTHVSNSVMLGWINACTLQLLSLIGTYNKTSIPGIVAAANITLPASLLRLDYASILIPGSTKVARLKTVDFCNFVRENPDWENNDPNQPQVLVRLTDQDWMMYPNPTGTAWAGQAVTCYGSVLPTPDTDFLASPPVNQSLHCAYEHYVAWKSFLLLNNPERAGQEFALYDGLRKQNTRTATSTNGSLQFLRMPQ